MPFTRPTEARQKAIIKMAKQFVSAKCIPIISTSTTPLLKQRLPILDSIKENERAVFLFEVAHEVIDYIEKNFLKSALWQENRLVISIGGTTVLLAMIAGFLFASQHNRSKSQFDDAVDGTFTFLGIAALIFILLISYIAYNKPTYSLEDQVTQYAKSELSNKKIKILGQLMDLFGLQLSENPRDDIIALSIHCKQLANTCATMIPRHYTDIDSEERATNKMHSKEPDIHSFFEKITKTTSAVSSIESTYCKA